MLNTHSLDLESGSSQLASITDAAQTGLDITGAMSIECWVKLESSPAEGTSMAFVSKQTTTGNQVSYQFYYQLSSGVYQLVFYISPDGVAANRTYLTKNVTLTNGTYYHLASTFDPAQSSGSRGKLYVNASDQSATDGLGTSIYNSSARFNIGAANSISPLNYLDGLIDDVRIWNDVRTPTEISTYYQTELAGNESNLQGYWKLNNTYSDETSNNNDLTASGSPVFSTTVPFVGTTTTAGIMSIL